MWEDFFTHKNFFDQETSCWKIICEKAPNLVYILLPRKEGKIAVFSILYTFRLTYLQCCLGQFCSLHRSRITQSHPPNSRANSICFLMPRQKLSSANSIKVYIRVRVFMRWGNSTRGDGIYLNSQPYASQASTQVILGIMFLKIEFPSTRLRMIDITHFFFK